jgi:DNA (cytosine-5)-methyltransferase 1
MNPYFITLQQAQMLVGTSVDINVVKHIDIDGTTYVDSRDINKAIVSKRIKYDFAKVNIKNNRFGFCQTRSINPCELNVIDLFCGAGGSSSGFRLAGFNLVGALDINAAAARTHEMNFPECKTVVGDITTLSPEEFSKMIGNKRVDIVIGSPPCQTFSSLSQGKIKSLGKDIKLDIRNYFYKN